MTSAAVQARVVVELAQSQQTEPALFAMAVLKAVCWVVPTGLR